LAEGTKQFMPNSGIDIRIQTFDNNDINRDFMTYEAEADERLHIHIDNVNTERIYYAFRQDNGDVYYRLRDPLGNIVVGPTLVSSSGNGYLANYNQAVAGPDLIDVINGYASLSFTPSIPGDYYIEFNRGDPDNFILGTSNVKRTFNFFDISVIDITDSTEITGRLWSKSWDFNCMSGTNLFEANLYSYSTDSIITAIDFNGMQPWGFVFLANATGTNTTGDVAEDRKSRTGNVNYPDYKVFLNVPDTLSEYKVTKVEPELIGPVTIEGCDLELYNIQLNSTHVGVAEISFDLDGTPGYQEGTSDRVILAQLVQGENNIPWDGRDGIGVKVPNATALTIFIEYQAGLVHIPIFDVENQTSGFIVNLIAPLSGTVEIFWDDSDIGGGSNLITPCLSGCHTWENALGNNQTINTYWITHFDSDTIVFTLYYDCAPKAMNDTVNVARDIPKTIDVQANDIETNGDLMTTTIVTGEGPANGVAIVVGTDIQYTPNSGYTGLDMLQYAVCDDNSPPPIHCDTAYLYISVECDDDGIPDSEEGSGDSDGDGVDDVCDLDADNDGITDAIEGSNDTDGDGIPDQLDLDSDNDGIPDAIEANNGVAPIGYDPLLGRASGADTDGDGLLDSYDNNSTVPYGVESISLSADGDVDGDGIKNRVDKDADNDGLADLIEAGGSDANNDGEVDNFTDFNNDGLNDFTLSNPLAIANTDGTGFVNYLDNDADADGIVDNREAQTSAGYTAIGSYLDSDGDGIIDQYDVTSGNNFITPIDSDNDGSSDYIDTDADGDSVLDGIEGNDANRDGVADSNAGGVDNDNDGIDDAFDSDGGTNFGGDSNYPFQNTDGDAEANFRDSDDDGDGVFTSNETADTDPTNGTPDYLEAAVCPVRFTSGGLIVIAGNADAVASQNGVADPIFSLGTPNGFFAELRNNDWIIVDLTDTVSNGETVVLTIAKASGGGTPTADVEQAMDGITFSNLQTYTSSVTAPTFESFNYVLNGANARYIRVTRTSRNVALDALTYSFSKVTCIADFDNDGIPDATDNDADNDGIEDTVEGGADTDGDGIINSLDLDSDNDGIPDAVEANGGVLPVNMNTQGFFPSAYIFANDSDGDGFANAVDASTGGTTLTNDDTDGDGIKDVVDLDADGDGINDAIEGNNGALPANMDDNGQYPIAYITANDTDGDGLANDVDADNGGTSLLLPNTDGLGLVDYLDTDADEDGANDNLEGFDPAVTPVGTDTDNDGIDDAFDPDCSPCGAVTGSPTNLPDQDLDGIPDYLEVCISSAMAGNWNSPSTWLGGQAPGVNDCVIVTHDVTLNTTAFATSLTLSTGGTLTTTGNTIFLTADLIGTGGNFAGTGKVTLNGTQTQSIEGTLDLYDLELDNANGLNASSGAVISIGSLLTLTQGTFNTTSATDVLFKSDVNGTAFVSGTGTGGLSGGKITLEKYLSGCEGYLTLGAPFNATFNDFNNFYFQGFTGALVDTGWVNTYFYEEEVLGISDNGYAEATNMTQPINKGVGFLNFNWAVMFPRTMSLQGPYSLAAFALPITYTANAGNLNDGYNLVANPFPSAIDWKSATGWTKVGCCDAIYSYNRCVNQYSSFVGGIGVNGGASYISPFQGFWVKAHSVTAAITVNRNAIIDNDQGLYKGSDNFGRSVLKFKINAYGYTDESAISFGDTTEANGLGSWYGAYKMPSSTPYYPSISSIQEMTYDSFDMAINMLPKLMSSKTIQLKTRVAFDNNYQIDFTGLKSFGDQTCIYLEDQALDTIVNLKTDSVYSFSMLASTSFSNRFKLHFKPPVNIELTEVSCPANRDGKAIAKIGAEESPVLFVWKDNNEVIIRSTGIYSTSDTLTNLAEGAYCVEVIDTSTFACGTYQSEFEVTINNSPVRILSTAINHLSHCDSIDGAIVPNVNGGNGIYSYSWSNGATTTDLSNIPSGTYVLNVTDGNNCVASEVYSVSSPASVSSYFSLSSDTFYSASITFPNNSVNANSYVWNFGDGATSSLSSPSYHYLDTGVYVVSLLAIGVGCSDNFSKTIYIKENLISGVGEFESKKIAVYPNPNQGVINVLLKDPKQISSLKIYNNMGEKIAELVLLKTLNTIDLTTVANGVYHIKLYDLSNKEILKDRFTIIK
jgi:hypothetical protein